MTFETKLKTIEDVKTFVKTALSLPCEVLVSEGQCRVDGKSIMGIFSLNLSNPVTVEVDSCYAEAFEQGGAE